MSDTSPLTAAECADRLRTLSTGLQALFGPIDTGMVIDAASHLDRLAAVERDAPAGDCAQLRMLLDRARQKNAELNRRCQSAEAGLNAKVLDAGPGNFGRMFANSAASMYRHQLAEAKAEIERLRAATPSGDRSPEPEQGT